MKYYHKIHKASPITLWQVLTSLVFGFSLFLQLAPVLCFCYILLKRHPETAKGNLPVLEPTMALMAPPPQLSLPSPMGIPNPAHGPGPHASPGAEEGQKRGDRSASRWPREPRTEIKSFLEEAARLKSRRWARSHTEEEATKPLPLVVCGAVFFTGSASSWIFFKLVLQVYVQVKSNFKGGEGLLFCCCCCVLRWPFFGTLGRSLKGKGAGRNPWQNQSPVTHLTPRAMQWNKVLRSCYSSPQLHPCPAQSEFHFASPSTTLLLNSFLPLPSSSSSITCGVPQETLASGPVQLFAFHLLS